ncbi:MAG: exodeoxyribonuclease VII small subunit [Bdellovibrionales bacterium]
MNFETKLNRLEEIVGKMEGGELALEDSLKMFEEGVKLVRECQTQLNAAEQKVKVLMSVDADGNPLTADFAAKE